MKTVPLRKVGKCIYCGTTEGPLTEEHIIPYSLDAHDTLLEASCKRCEDTTKKFEGSYARGSLRYFRAALNLPTRRKKERPKTRPVTVEKGGMKRVEQVPIEEYGPCLPVAEFALPGYFYIRNWQHKIGLHPKILGMNMLPLFAQEHNKKFFGKYRGEAYHIEEQVNPQEFARMLAKIAYCWVVASYGVDDLDEVFVLPAIMGKAEEVWHWVGSDGYRMRASIDEDPDTPHMLLAQVLEDGVVLVRIRLFRKFEAPEYLVVVGRVSQDLLDRLMEKRREAPAEVKTAHISPNLMPEFERT